MAVKFRWMFLTAAGLALAVPGPAEAATKSVFMGLPPPSQRQFQQTATDVNAFFPRSIRIRRGDTVSFAPAGFHTADFPPRGGTPLPLITGTGPVVSGVNDAAGVPFWFNNQPQLGLNRNLTRSNFGKTRVKRATRITSGLPLGNRPRPFRVRFPRAGLFRYICNVHPGMTGTVRVVGRRSRVPSRAADARRVRRQIADARGVARRLPDSVNPPANTVSVGAEGRGGVTFFGFLPSRLTVPVGTTVRFTMPVASTEDHTATTGPGNPNRASTYLGAIAASFQAPVFDPRGTYPSEPPGSPPARLSPALHGNGFWNSGVLDARPSSPPPQSSSVTFAARGTYPFVCLIHPFMRGSVTVS